MHPIPLPEDLWGILAPLRGTSWGQEIPVISGEILAHAKHGLPKMFRQALGTLPRNRPKRLPTVQAFCWERQLNTCAAASGHCIPGSGKLPPCYSAPSPDETLRMLGATVGRAWDEGRYVFLIDGPEHVLR